MTDIENRVVDEVEKVVKGKRDIIIKVYAAILADIYCLRISRVWARPLLQRHLPELWI